MRALAGLLALGALAGCGGFDNAQLGRAGLLGRVVGAEAPLARAVLRVEADAPDAGEDDGDVDAEDTFVARVEPGGHFELMGVPAGTGVLHLVASASHAARLEVRLEAGRVLDVGDVVAQPGAFIDVQVLGPEGHAVAHAEVDVEDAGLDDVTADAQGRARLGPLPEGCYRVRARMDDVGEARQELCVAGGRTHALTLVLAAEDTGG